MKKYVFAILLGVCWYQPFYFASEVIQDIEIPGMTDVNQIAWSVDNHLAILWWAAGSNTKLSIWDGSITKEFTPDGLTNVTNVSQIAWSADNHLAIAWRDSSGSKKLSIWDNTTETISKEFTTTYGGELPGLTDVWQIAWSADNHLAISWSYNDENGNSGKQLSIWDSSSDTITNSEIDVSQIAWSADNHLAIKWSDGSDKLSIWDSSSDTITDVGGELSGMTDVLQLAWSADNHLAIAWRDSSWKQHLSIWDDAKAEGEKIKTFTTTELPGLTNVWQIALSADNHLAIEWSDINGRKLSIWDSNNNTITDVEGELPGLTYVLQLAWSADNHLAIEWSDDNGRKLSIWDGTNLKTFTTTTDPEGDLPGLANVGLITWSADNHLAILWWADSDTKLSIWRKVYRVTNLEKRNMLLKLATDVMFFIQGTTSKVIPYSSLPKSYQIIQR